MAVYYFALVDLPQKIEAAGFPRLSDQELPMMSIYGR